MAALDVGGKDNFILGRLVAGTLDVLLFPMFVHISFLGAKVVFAARCMKCVLKRWESHLEQRDWQSVSL